MATGAQARRAGRTPKQDRSRTSLRRLMETAEVMLERDGYSGFTLQALSKRAKVSIGSIYHLFSNKQELIRELQVRFLERVEQEHAVVINELRRDRLPLKKLLPAAVRDYGEHLRNISPLLRVFMQVAPTDARIAANGKRYYSQSMKDFELLILDRRNEIRHPNPEHAVATCYTVLYSVIGRYLGLGTTQDVMGEGDWDTLVQDTTEMLLFYLLGDPQKIKDSA